MPQLEKELWIEGGYYVDFDDLHQFRIIGPQNHLFCGLLDIPRHRIRIDSVEPQDGSIVIRGCFMGSSITLYDPAMDDVRTMRDIMESTTRQHPVTFLDVRSQTTEKLIPQTVEIKKMHNETHVVFRRSYDKKWYGTTFVFRRDIDITRIKKPFAGLSLKAQEGDCILFNIVAETNDFSEAHLGTIFLPDAIDFSKFNHDRDSIKNFWDRTRFEIRHLLIWHKTSGDRYGTIFPRDWMESADLGTHDLSDEAREYMYTTALEHVDEKGMGWHEDAVGEYRYKRQKANKDVIDRKMIDIEPRYILGLKRLNINFVRRPDVREKLQRVAHYILEEARTKDIILFRKHSAHNTRSRSEKDSYFSMGNWRDSEWAFKKVSDTIAPFDVNAVFYPEALKVLKKLQGALGLEPIADIDKLIEKWETVRKLYLFSAHTEKHGDVSAYALALYNVHSVAGKLTFDQLKVNHLDEAYLYTYGDETPEQLRSFCIRLLDPQFFYTPSGPLLIAKNNGFGYTTQEYHGLVIWTKQAAFTVLGLSKHYKRAKKEGWDAKTTALLRETILKICHDMIHVFAKLKAIPELHFDADGTPKFFTDQQGVQGKMSKVQLWSAVGARRLIHKYYELISEEK